jgi:tRNA uridine 5-carbamoylmethylation protein Kti12
MEDNTYNFFNHGCPITMTFYNDCGCLKCGFFLRQNDKKSHKVGSLDFYPKYNKQKNELTYHCAEFEDYECIETDSESCGTTFYKVWINPQIQWIIGEENETEKWKWYNIMEQCTDDLIPDSQNVTNVQGILLDVYYDFEFDEDGSEYGEQSEDVTTQVYISKFSICPNEKDIISTLSRINLLDLVYFFKYYQTIVPLRKKHSGYEIICMVKMIQNTCKKINCINNDNWKDYIDDWLKKLYSHFESPNTTTATTLSLLETIKILEKMHKLWNDVEGKMRLMTHSPFANSNLMKAIISEKSHKNQVLNILYNFEQKCKRIQQCWDVIKRWIPKQGNSEINYPYFVDWDPFVLQFRQNVIADWVLNQKKIWQRHERQHLLKARLQEKKLLGIPYFVAESTAEDFIVYNKGNIDQVIQKIELKAKEYQAIIELISPVITGDKPILYVPSRNSKKIKLVHIIAENHRLQSKTVQRFRNHSSMLVYSNHFFNSHHLLDFSEFNGDEVAYKKACELSGIKK